MRKIKKVRNTEAGGLRDLCSSLFFDIIYNIWDNEKSPGALPLSGNSYCAVISRT